MDDQDYRLPFGKHKGQTVQEIPMSYRLWLLGQEIYADKPGLKAALIQAGHLSPTVNTESAPGTPPKKRKLSETESSLPASSAKKLAISKEAKRNGTMLNFDGATYILDFGKHSGQKLKDVPRNYVDWLITTSVHGKRLDLAAALREEGFLVENLKPEAIDPTWRAPSIHDIGDDRLWDHDMNAPLWISDMNASRYFRLGEPLLSQSGVRLVSETSLRRSSEYGELIPYPKVPIRWLAQVYACAGHYASADAAEQGLKDFLGKNQRREQNILDGMRGGIFDDMGWE